MKDHSPLLWWRINDISVVTHRYLPKYLALKISSSGSHRAHLVIKPVFHYSLGLLIMIFFLCPVWIPFLQLSAPILAFFALCIKRKSFFSSSETPFFNVLKYHLVPADSFSVYWTSSLHSAFLRDYIFWSSDHSYHFPLQSLGLLTGCPEPECSELYL